MKSTFATFAWLSATINMPDAVAVVAATARPATPIARKAATGWAWLTNATKTASARAAKNARPASWVAVSTESSRWTTPAVDHAIAARTTNSCPRRRAACASGWSR